MRKIQTILAALFMTSALIAQIPQKMSYQAIIRDAGSALIANQGIGMRLTILDGLNPVFVETHSATTDVNGLVTVEVGTGTPVTGTLDGINWGSGVFTIKTETDPTALGGIAYTIIGTSDVLSVPYALHVKTAADATFSGDYNDLINKPVLDGTETKVNAGQHISVSGTGATGSPYVVSAMPVVGGFSHYLGEDTGEGVIFYLYTGSDGKERALIANYEESKQILQTPNSTTGGTRTYDGVYNTTLYTNSPAKNYVEAFGPGWYIPSIDELTYMWQNRFHLNRGLAYHGAPATLLTLLNGDSKYWSSTESTTSSTIAWNFDFETGLAALSTSKTNSPGLYVRAIKAFSFIPSLTTADVTNITSTTATCGGNITNDNGESVTARGVCWNTTGRPTIADSKTSDGSGTGSFTSSITGLVLGTTYYVRAYATNFEGTNYGDIKVFKAVAIGDTWGGGIVYYILQSGDPGYDALVPHGLIAADADQNPGVKWSETQTNIAGAVPTAIGAGSTNTSAIVLNQGAFVYAARICELLNYSGQTDWFLPSRDELNQLYTNRTYVGIAAGFYWSSSQFSNSNAIYLDFSTGNISNTSKTAASYRVRAIRKF